MNTERDEHSYKISLRAARLLRDSPNDRARAFIEVKRIYDLRSSMVHNGKIKGNFKIDGAQVSPNDLVESVDTLCTEAIRKFIESGGFSGDNWREIELG